METFDAIDQCRKCLRKSLNKNDVRIKVINTASEVEAVRDQLNINVEMGFKLCDKCRRLVFFGSKAVEEQSSTSDQVQEEQVNSQFSELSVELSQTPSTSQSSGSVFELVSWPTQEKKPTVELPLQRCVASHKYCCICKRKYGLTTVPMSARLQCFNKLKIFIPNGNRVCSEHLIKQKIFEDDLKQIEVHHNVSYLTAEEICTFLSNISDLSSQSVFDKVKSAELTEKQIYSFTGLTYDKLQELTSLLVSMRKSHSRDINQAVVIFLFKLRTGASNDLISSIFDIENPIKISDFCESVINSFEKDILPSQFGVKSVVREDLIRNHTSFYAKKLFNLRDDQLALIFDGTYLRHEKSKNNEYQRKSYSGQKKVPLCKPFTICTTDGFVVDVPGPFLANENDASIMKKVMEDPDGLKLIMKKGDICIVDRGFRDVVPYLEELGFKVLMPALKGKRPNLTALEANESRLVTKLRWVVEAVHGVLGKKFKLLHHQLDNKLLSRARSYVRIANFLNNRFGKRLNSDQYDEGLQDIIIERMLNSIQIENTLAVEVETSRWSRRSTTTTKLSSQDVMDFPEMTEKDLKIYFSGTYQLGQAICYLAELMDDSDNINMEYIKVKPNIVKVLVRSRHINKKTYKCYIEYKPNSIGYSGIQRHTCDCANGLRTVGSCSHVAAIIYYLSNARFQSKIVRPAKKLSELFSPEDIDPVINDDSDDD